jgi:uncharacterized RDD family membrane protein YckC
MTFHSYTTANCAAPDSGMVFASWLVRGLAKLIDWLLLGLCFVPVDFFLGTSIAIERHSARHSVVGIIVFSSVWLVYESVMESSKYQATVGKRTLGIIVTDNEGRRISLRRAFLRNIVQVLVAWLLVDYLAAALTPRRQALHDVLANTLVRPGSL